MSALGALAAVDRIVGRGGDADDILRAVVAALVDDGGCNWAGILFAEEDELILGPQAGTPDLASRSQVAVVFNGARVAELVADGGDASLLERVAQVVAPYCLVGWDTGGVPWDEIS